MSCQISLDLADGLAHQTLSLGFSTVHYTVLIKFIDICDLFYCVLYTFLGHPVDCLM